MYSVKSSNASVHEIYAMRDCYIDAIAQGGDLNAGDIVFKLNTFEMDRETFKLAVELQNSQIAVKRLTQDYVDRLIVRPLTAGIEFAAADLVATKEELDHVTERYEIGVGTLAEVFIASAQHSERQSLLARSEADLTQRNIEIDGQRRRLEAEMQDLNDRIALNAKIRELHEFRMPARGNVTIIGYQGAFVEEGDLICQIAI